MKSIVDMLLEATPTAKWKSPHSGKPITKADLNYSADMSVNRDILCLKAAHMVYDKGFNRHTISTVLDGIVYNVIKGKLTIIPNDDWSTYDEPGFKECLAAAIKGVHAYWVKERASFGGDRPPGILDTVGLPKEIHDTLLLSAI